MRPVRVSALVILLILIGAALRLIHLDADSLWFDELYTELTSRSASPIAILQVLPPNWSPLYPFTVAIFRRLADSSALVIRLPAAWAGIISIAAMYALGKRLHNHQVGVIASALMTPSIFLINYSQEARSYAFLVLFTLLTVWAWLPLYRRLASDGGMKLADVLIFAAFALGALYSDFLSIPLILVLLGLLVFKAWSHRKHVLAILSIGLLISLIYIPNVTPLLGQASQLQWLGWIKKPTNFPLTLATYLTIPFNSPVVMVIIFGVILITGCWRQLTLFRLKKRIDIAPLALLSWFVLPFVGLYIVSIIFKPLLVYRYLIGAMVAAYLLAGLSLVHLPLKNQWRYLLIIGVVAYMTIEQVFLQTYYTELRNGDLDIVSAALAETITHEDVQIPILMIGFGLTQEYYFDRYGIPEPAAILEIESTPAMIEEAVVSIIESTTSDRVLIIVMEREINLSSLGNLSTHDLELVTYQTYVKASLWEFSVAPTD